MPEQEGPLDPESTIEEMSQNGKHDEEPVFALEGDRQLTLAGLGGRSARNIPIEAEVSIMSASVPCRGLIDPDKQGQLLDQLRARRVPLRAGPRRRARS